MYCSCINYIHALSFSQLTLENVYKISENVSFCYCTEITIALKKMYPKKSFMRSIRSSGVGKRPPGKEKDANSRGYTRGKHGNGLN